MNIGVPKLTAQLERRVALTPDIVQRLVDQGLDVVVESNAGRAAGFLDALYHNAGARLGTATDAWGADLVASVGSPDDQARAYLRSGKILIGLLQPLDNPGGIARLADTGITAFAFETLPRTTRAQAMDVLSSQATVAGYQAALVGAARLPKLFPMMTTAAGTIAPARVLVLGAGVAGLQAIATARRLGAVVSAFDVRSAAAEQVQSLGATFVDVNVERQDEKAAGGYAQEVTGSDQDSILAGLAPHVSESDVVISTAQIPGRPAPLLITAGMVRAMRPGSVIVDVAASSGGNCEVTDPDKEVIVDDVLVLGPTDLVSRGAADASRMYARNMFNLISLVTGAEGLDFNDDIIAGCVITHGGKIVNDRVNALLEAS